MGPMHDWLYMVAAIAGLTVVTVLTRGSFFMLPASVQLPGRVERALKYAPSCALAAIVAPGVLSKQGDAYVILPRGRELISYYANGISHLCGAFEAQVKARDALPMDTLVGL